MELTWLISPIRLSYEMSIDTRFNVQFVTDRSKANLKYDLDILNRIRREPNHESWISREGYQCSVSRHTSSLFLCGYISVPEGHPWFGKNYDELGEVAAHGGFTLSCEKDSLWMLGFDCGHAGDWTFSPYSERFAHTIFNSDIYRDFAYVKSTVNSLSIQAQLVVLDKGAV